MYKYKLAPEEITEITENTENTPLIMLQESETISLTEVVIDNSLKKDKPFKQIPVEVWTNIVSYLEVPDTLKLRSSCKFMNSTVINTQIELEKTNPLLPRWIQKINDCSNELTAQINQHEHNQKDACIGHLSCSFIMGYFIGLIPTALIMSAIHDPNDLLATILAAVMISILNGMMAAICLLAPFDYLNRSIHKEADELTVEERLAWKERVSNNIKTTYIPRGPTLFSEVKHIEDKEVSEQHGQAFNEQVKIKKI